MKKLFLLSVITLFCFQISNAQNQKVYGLTEWGGLYGGGTIYRMNPDGSGFEVMFNFQSPDGYTPKGSLMQASNGMLFGSCYNGGDYASCTIFDYDTLDHSCVDVYDFDISNGDFPESGQVEGPGGILYGVTPYGGAMGAGVIYKYDLGTGVYSNIFDFATSTGSNAAMTPIIEGGNMLYGTAPSGGLSNAGVIYSYNISTDAYAQVHTFTTTDGGSPRGGLIKAADGKFYGMTMVGGANSAGVIYSFDPSNSTFTKLYDFVDAEGANPRGQLVQASSGIFYGTTANGGISNNGVIFTFDASTSTYTALHKFDGTTGATPMSELSVGADGKLYGTTANGGWSGMGVAFAYNLATSQITVIKNFDATSGYPPAGGFAMLDEPEGPESINETTLSNSISVFPNPATDVISVSSTMKSSENAKFSILALTGQEVLSFENNTLSGDFTKQISIAKLAPGAYFLEVSVGTTKTVEKFIKQ